jgi:septum formation protein
VISDAVNRVRTKASKTPLGTERAVVLASASQTRRRLLASCGVEAAADAARIDEPDIKASMERQGAAPAEIALALAETKATLVSGRHPDALVIGADQILVLDGAIFDKPVDRASAAATLRRLRGRRHDLVSALAVVLDGTLIWRLTEQARLTMRAFSDGFLEAYLDAVGEQAYASVGAYCLEGPGLQLFTEVEGDYFTILGLPLLPLLAFLRERGAVRR